MEEVWCYDGREREEEVHCWIAESDVGAVCRVDVRGFTPCTMYECRRAEFGEINAVGERGGESLE